MHTFAALRTSISFARCSLLHICSHLLAFFRRFTTILPLLVGSAFSNVAYDVSGPVLGDFTTPESFPPKVVLNYLATCSDVDIANPNGCLVSTFAERRISFDYSDAIANQRAPSVTESEIVTAAFQAQASCSAKGDSVTMQDANTLVQQYQAILDFNDGACWTSLAAEKASLSLESKWIKTCADTKLPYPIPQEDVSMFTMDSVHHRSILTCMLDLVFEMPPATFDLPAPTNGSPETCFPPGHTNIATVCPSVLGPRTAKLCLDADATRNDDSEMSMSYSGGSAKGNTDPAIFVDEFCDLMVQLSSDVGRGCLLDLCEFDPTAAPTTTTQSASPSVAVSASPSLLASSAPTSSPSKVESASPTHQASASPTESPSWEPSISQFPTYIDVQAVVDIEVFSTVTLNISSTDVPSDNTDFLGVMAMAIKSLIVPSEVTVRLPEGTRRIRRLESGDKLDLSVQVSATRDCFVEKCDEFGAITAGRIEREVVKAALNGTLTSSINGFARMEHVGILEHAVVGSFQFVNNTVAVDTVKEDEDDTSSASISINKFYSIVAALVGIILV